MRIAAILMLLLCPLAAMGGEPQAALTQAASAPLPVQGRLLGVAQDGLVVAADKDGGGLLLLLDQVTLQITAIATLDAPVIAMAAREDRDGVGVLTDAGQGVTLHRFGARLHPLAAVSVGLLDRPALSLTATGQSVVSAAAGDFYFSVFDEQGLRVDTLKTYEATRPIAQAWIAKDVGYFSAAHDKRLSAANLKTGTSYSEYNIFFKDGRAVQPFSVAPLLADRDCRRDYQTEFLLADAELGMITLLRTDPDRSILRQVAEAAVDTREPAGPKGQILIGSSCNGAAVWLAGANSSTLSQFSVVREGDRLEQVGTAKIPGPAAALALNWDGQSGWLLLRDEPRLIRFELSAGEPPPLSGDDKVRELQRLLLEKGYPVGAIDGVIGDRTRRATSLIGRTTGTDLSIGSQQGLTQTIEMLKELPASKY